MKPDPVPPPGDATPDRPRSRYIVGEFCADARRLARATAPRDVDLVDGRLRALPLSGARRALDSGEAAGEFVSRYQELEAAGARYFRFRQVAEFLVENEPRLAEAGLARPGEPLLVREELLSFLLDYPTLADQRLPPGALVEFLDHWGHRH